MARIGNRIPKEHIIIVTGTIGYVIVVVDRPRRSLVGGILVIVQGESDGGIPWRFVVVIHTCGQ